MSPEAQHRQSMRYHSSQAKSEVLFILPLGMFLQRFGLLKEDARLQMGHIMRRFGTSSRPGQRQPAKRQFKHKKMRYCGIQLCGCYLDVVPCTVVILTESCSHADGCLHICTLHRSQELKWIK